METVRRLRTVLLAAICAPVAIACARNSQPTTSAISEQTEPPRLWTRGSAPEIAIPESNAGGRPTVRIGIQVMVDSEGRADVRTLKLTGIVGTQDRIALERWLQTVTFRPAMRNGQPVSGLFKMTLAARVVRR